MIVGIRVLVTVRLFGTLYQTISPESCIVISLRKFDFKLHYSCDGLYMEFYFQPLRML